MKVDIGPYKESENESRTVEVQIDDYDYWNLDHTLALIIYPALKIFREKTIGAGRVDNEDVPEELRRPEDLHPYEDDENFIKRSEYVLDEMIYAFSTIVNEDYYNKSDERLDNGLRLFGKYYRSLWD